VGIDLEAKFIHSTL